MRDTVFVLSRRRDRGASAPRSRLWSKRVNAYVPGYRLKQPCSSTNPESVNVPGVGEFTALKTSVFLEVEGAAHYLPSYAGNLDIMTSAALRTAETIATRALALQEA